MTDLRISQCFSCLLTDLLVSCSNAISSLTFHESEDNCYLSSLSVIPGIRIVVSPRGRTRTLLDKLSSISLASQCPNIYFMIHESFES